MTAVEIVKVGYSFDSMGLGFLLALIIINSYLQVSKSQIYLPVTMWFFGVSKSISLDGE